MCGQPPDEFSSTSNFGPQCSEIMLIFLVLQMSSFSLSKLKYSEKVTKIIFFKFCDLFTINNLYYKLMSDIFCDKFKLSWQSICMVLCFDMFPRKLKSLSAWMQKKPNRLIGSCEQILIDYKVKLWGINFIITNHKLLKLS